MQEPIFVSFFVLLFGIFRSGLLFSLFMLALIVVPAVAEGLVLLRQPAVKWTLPIVLLAIVVFCELLWQTGLGRFLIFIPAAGIVCLSGLLGALCAILLHILWTKILHS